MSFVTKWVMCKLLFHVFPDLCNTVYNVIYEWGWLLVIAFAHTVEEIEDLSFHLLCVVIFTYWCGKPVKVKWRYVIIIIKKAKKEGRSRGWGTQAGGRGERYYCTPKCVPQNTFNLFTLNKLLKRKSRRTHTCICTDTTIRTNKRLHQDCRISGQLELLCENQLHLVHR